MASHKKIYKNFHIITTFSISKMFIYKHPEAIYNMLKIGYFLRKIQTARVNNSKTVRIFKSALAYF